MIRSLLKSLLVLAVFAPFAAALPLASVSLCRTSEGAQVVFWLGPWSAAFWTLIYSTLSAVPWREGASAVRQHRLAHGGLLVASAKGTIWMFGALVFSYLAEAALLFLTRRFTLLPAATYSPLFACWLWRRVHGPE